MKQIHVVSKISSKWNDYSFLSAVPLRLILILFSHLGLRPSLRTTSGLQGSSETGSTIHISHAFEMCCPYISLWFGRGGGLQIKKFLIMHFFPSLILGIHKQRTYCMEQSPSWEAHACSTIKEIPTILLNPQVLFLTHKSPPPVCPEPNESSPCPPIRIASVHYRPIVMLPEGYAHICVFLLRMKLRFLPRNSKHKNIRVRNARVLLLDDVDY
jgi:hypothetical protein